MEEETEVLHASFPFSKEVADLCWSVVKPSKGVGKAERPRAPFGLKKTLEKRAYVQRYIAGGSGSKAFGEVLLQSRLSVLFTWAPHVWPCLSPKPHQQDLTYTNTVQGMLPVLHRPLYKEPSGTRTGSLTAVGNQHGSQERQAARNILSADVSVSGNLVLCRGCQQQLA